MKINNTIDIKLQTEPEVGDLRLITKPYQWYNTELKGTIVLYLGLWDTDNRDNRKSEFPYKAFSQKVLEEILLMREEFRILK